MVCTSCYVFTITKYADIFILWKLITGFFTKHRYNRNIGIRGLEVKYEVLKNKLELENMSGRRVVTTYQDFWAKLDLANTMAALEYATDEIIEENTASSSNKHKQTTNENRLVTKFSDRYIEILITDDPDERMTLFNELVDDIARRPVEVKPGRKFKRVPPRKKKFCDRRKRALR